MCSMSSIQDSAFLSPHTLKSHGIALHIFSCLIKENVFSSCKNSKPISYNSFYNYLYYFDF